MDFANERYVRLYTRDTMGWKKLRWEGRLVWMELYRKADRSGVVSLGGDEPWEAAVLLCDIPEDVAKVGMERCLDREWIVRDGDRLVFPEYIPANETPQSDAQRQRESRARRASVTKRDDQSRNVTDCHAESHGVTPSHTASLLTVPSRAVLNRAVPSEHARAREEQGSDHWAEGQTEQTIRSDFQRRYEVAVQSIPNQLQVSKMAAKVAPWVTETARLRKLTEDVVTRRLFDGFFASDTARAKGFPPAYLGANPLEYFDPPPQPKPITKTIGGARYAGPSEVSTNPEDYAVGGDFKW